MTDLEKLIGTLVDGGIEFIIVGGLAATAHGSSRLTQVIDIVYSRTPGNMERLEAALAPHGPYLRGAPEGLPLRVVKVDHRTRPQFHLIHCHR